MSWTGRTLDSIVKADGTQIAYIYDIDGIRTKKVVDGVTTEYFVNGTTVLAQKTGNDIIWFIYDVDGEILGFTYNDVAYYYVKNLQGDVVLIVNSTGLPMGSYTYDPWGKITSATGTMAEINPIRYRGYYYDSETGLYYLNSRYYDPDTCRFINADGYVSTGQGIAGNNMFAYCLNNPVNMVDPTGNCAADALTGIVCDDYFFQKLNKNLSDLNRKAYPFKFIGTYNNGKNGVYIAGGGNNRADSLIQLASGIDDENVYIVDCRIGSKNPTMVVVNSYRITNAQHIKEISQIMINYNKRGPLKPVWNRTLDSLIYEWGVHNAFYSEYGWEMFQHCDFDKKAEGKDVNGMIRDHILEWIF